MASSITLEGVTWRRPGVLEVVVAQKFRTRGEPEPAVVDYRSVFDAGDATLRLIERHTRFEGTASSRVCKYQTATPMASPTAERGNGYDPERETWSANVAMNQRNITLHPNLSAILAAGWGSVNQDKVFWPRMIYEERGEVDPVTGAELSMETPVKNPYYGTTSYFAPRIEITRDLYLDSGGVVDGTMLDAIGWLDSALKSFPFAEDQEFILSANSILRGRGNQVLRTSWTSDPFFPDPVYNKDWKG